MKILKIKKQKTFSVLDIGSEAVKAIVFERELEKTQILESYLQYFDDYDILERRILAVKDVLRRFDRKPESVILGLSSDILKARVILQAFARENPSKIINKKERETIYHTVFKKAKEEISRIFSQKMGILPPDIKIVNIRITEMMIDGYEVPFLGEYAGKNLFFKVLVSFLPEYHVKEIDKICQAAGFKNKKIVHEAELSFKKFGDWGDGILLDVGGETTQIFLTKNRRLEQVNEFGGGGKIFSQAISKKLGLGEKDARIFKEKYAQKELTLESSHRLREILYFPAREWFENLKAKLKEMKEIGLFSKNILLFGGASQLPEIREILEQGDWGNISFADAKPEVKIFKNPQFFPALLISSYIVINNAKKDY